MDESQVSESGATSTEGSASPESASPAQSQDAGSSQEGASGKQEGSNTSPNTPFHEHPRFKELIEQKNQSAKELQEYRQQMQEMRSQLESLSKVREASAQQREKDELLERLKGIDPVFGGRFEEIERMARESQQYYQEVRNQENSRQAYSRLDQLYKENNVPESFKGAYEAAIKAAAYENPKATLNDLDKYFKQAHSMFDNVRRAERESYVQTKKADSTPATQSGGSAAPVGNSKSSFKSLDEVKQAILREARAATQKV